MSFKSFFKTSSRCVHDVFKTSLRRLQDVLHGVFKTFSRRLQDVLHGVFKTSSRSFQDVLQKRLRRSLQDVFRMYHQVKTALVNTFSKWFWDVFKTFLRRTTKAVIYRKICLGHTSKKIMVSVQTLQESQNIFKFWFPTLLRLLVAAYRGVFRSWSNITMELFLRKYLTVLLSC